MSRMRVVVLQETQYVIHLNHKRIRRKSGPLPRTATPTCSPHNMSSLIIQGFNRLRSFPKPSTNTSRFFLSAVRSTSSMSQPVRPRRFAPLDPTKRRDGDDRPVLKGIVFDVDGTLCKAHPKMRVSDKILIQC
jgi:hypothetical protein